jgi:hypothetical protein
MIDLSGYIDPHVHAAPEHIPRLLDDISVAQQAREARMAGVMLKSHTALTADRATITEKVVPGIHIWGGLVLNKWVGGFNPVAVETALAYGAAEIWMPTHDATNHYCAYGLGGQGLCVEDATLPAIHDILALIAQKDVILGTGHLSTAEIHTVVSLARDHGVKKILITHPEAPFINLPLDDQIELARQGCRLERTWVFTTPALGQILAPAQILGAIRQVGTDSTVLATDMGQVGNPSPVEGLRAYVRACQKFGFTSGELRRMAAENIAEWLPT